MQSAGVLASKVSSAAGSLFKSGPYKPKRWGIVTLTDGEKVCLPDPESYGYRMDEGGAFFEVKHKMGVYLVASASLLAYNEIAAAQGQTQAQFTHPTW